MLQDALTMEAALQYLAENNSLRTIDAHAGRFIYRICNDPVAALAAALISKASGEGHVCLPLDELAGILSQVDSLRPMDRDDLRNKLLASSAAGSPGEVAPLILTDDDFIYLHKYFQLEESVSQSIRCRGKITHSIDLAKGRQILSQIFDSDTSRQSSVDLQRTAAAMALLKPLLIVSGGPGTGKTYAVSRIIAALGAFFPDSLHICLAAPTGKAAARLKESIQQARKSLPQQYRKHIPDEASTIHRLLQFNPHTRQFQHNRNHQLAIDVLILDEASMIDIVLMASIFDALPDHCRLILLGDKNQLASVEAGNIFGDICGQHPPRWSMPLQTSIEYLTDQPPVADKHGLPVEDNIVFLEKSYRFHQKSGIGTLAAAVNEQNVNLLKSCSQESFADLSMVEQEKESLESVVSNFSDSYFSAIFTADSPQNALTVFEKSRILCVTRQGATGTDQINRRIEQQCIRQKLIENQEEYYRGQPVMVTVNDYALELFNGDTGIIWPDEQDKLCAWFETSESSLRSIALGSLPKHQTCYAITVHKSQGSEFDHVLFILPAKDSPLLTKELLYTAITRAKHQLSLFSTRERLESTTRRKSQRFSGLYKRLRI